MTIIVSLLGSLGATENGFQVVAAVDKNCQMLDLIQVGKTLQLKASISRFSIGLQFLHRGFKDCDTDRRLFTNEVGNFLYRAFFKGLWDILSLLDDGRVHVLGTGPPCQVGDASLIDALHIYLLGVF